MMPRAEELASAARSLVGTRWVHQGRIPGLALDCAGLLIASARAIGLKPIDRITYTLPADPGVFLEVLAQNADRDELPQHGVGRVIAFRLGRGEPQHFGIRVDADHFVHGFDKRRAVVIEPIARWLERFHSTWRVRGVDYQEAG